VFTIAHAVKYALARARAATLAFLVSLIVGALRAPIVEVSIRLAESGETWSAAAPRFALAAVGGAALVLMLDRYSAGDRVLGTGGSAAFEALAVGPRKRHRPIVGSDGRGSQVIIAITIIAVMTSRDRRKTEFDTIATDRRRRERPVRRFKPRSPNRRDDAFENATDAVGVGRRRRRRPRRWMADANTGLRTPPTDSATPATDRTGLRRPASRGAHDELTTTTPRTTRLESGSSAT